MADSGSRTPDRSQVNDLSKAQLEAVRQAQAELDKVFDTVYNMYDDPAEIRDALLDLVPAIARKYGNLGSVAAAEWYDRMRAKWFKDDGYAADSTYDPDDVPMRKTVRRLAGSLWDKDEDTPADPDLMLQGLHAAMDRWVKAGGRETITRAVKKDPSKPRFARVPQGPTCGFCIMLASRGFVYSSAEAAGGDMNDYHNDCDCEPIPSWDRKSPKIEGYDPDRLYERYSACRATVEDLLTEERYRKTYRDVFVSRYEGDEPKTFDQWVARQIAAEMDTRDRQWLLDGKRVPVSYASLRAQKEVKSHEQKTIEYLAEHGFRQWIAERSNEPGKKTADAVINGQIVDYKSPEGNSYNGIDGLIKHAGQQHAIGAVIHLQKGRSIVSVEDCDSHIIRSLSHRKKLSWVLRIDYDGNMRRFVNE